ncbi:alpha/beta fold hydrolase [Dactylosporangium aurantiacum]|uniref:Alpha/beta fold hydrolase n=1 Tax=Dactylosporangium aurantiacum TaxID=35754 RepID=A0A9Q9IPA5_9ACTN|nr:alpha/beta fold hydrolase [Dactylosporangium aurantiacum]MDG6103033.1 alpha/beta fold hydrolase [Dactylosporangium aurantiacum]UWZ57545.1 alpha/beta fold hydrolase [Dactylosporangium aurantiacum]
MRLAFRILERATPALGARWAERIWFRLPKRAVRAARTARAAGTPLPPGRPFTVKAGAADVAGVAWGEGPAVYLLHGWAGHRGQLEPFVPGLVGRGFTVVAFDAPSHGRSGPGAYGPRSSSIPEFAAALEAAVAAHGPAEGIVAHSLGSVAAAVALCDGLRAGRVVMIAPMASPASYAEYFARVLGFGPRVLSRLNRRVERRVGAPMRHFDVPELGRAVLMPPTLIVHDRADRSIPVADGIAIAEAWPTATLRITEGLGHRGLLREPQVVGAVVDFIDGKEPGEGAPPAGRAAAAEG